MTEADYFAAVDLLARRVPDHPLLDTCRQGYSKINVIYLRAAMAGHVEEVVETTEEPDPEWLEDDDYLDLQQRKSALFGRRFNLSNEFHDHTGDPIACANVSDEIRRVQQKIRTVFRQIEHYRRTGELLEDAPATERQYEGLALSRRYRTVQQNILNWKHRIKNDGPHTDPITAREWDKKLKEYERELTSLRAQIHAESV